MTDSWPTGFHFGRSFSGRFIEDDCPCQKADCGLVSVPDDNCDQHGLGNAKTIRQIHEPWDCPELKEASK